MPEAIRKIVACCLKFVGSFLTGLGNRVYLSPAEKRVQPWFAVDGDKTLRLEYDLDPKCLVFDVGGYEGQWASDVFGRYGCRILVFEPIPKYAEMIRQRFLRNPHIEVFEFGLADKDQQFPFEVLGDRSSAFRHAGTPALMCELRSVTRFLKSIHNPAIQLMKVNIEGGEYPLLEELIRSGDVKTITNLQIQFHDFVERAEERMAQLHLLLAETHVLTYQFPFVWENWRLKSE